MARISNKVYAKSDFRGWEAVNVSNETVEFSAKNPTGESVTLSATYRQVDFGEDASKAAGFFGSMAALINEAESSVNSWLIAQAKAAARNAAFGMAEKLEKAIAERIAYLTQKKGRQLTDSEVQIVRDRVTAAFSDEL